jgi:ABC-2 type transport system ATP-binding protein
LIEVEGLTRRFGELVAVDSLTFRVREGEVFGFLGPNGAGKTTTVRMLCCLISKTKGSAKIADYDIGNKADSPKIRKLIGLVPDNVGLYDYMSAYDNLDFYGRLQHLTGQQRKESIERFLKMLGLWEKKDTAAGTFSKGMRQKLAIARALIHDPEVLFLDEPTANLDPESAKTVRDFLLELKGQKKTIFLNTHNLDEAQRICDRIAILNTRLMALGTPEELEGAVKGRKTVIQLVRASDSITNAVKRLVSGEVALDNNRLTIDIRSPETENPLILRAIFDAGGDIVTVSVQGSTLEDAYLSLVRKAN